MTEEADSVSAGLDAGERAFIDDMAGDPLVAADPPIRRNDAREPSAPLSSTTYAEPSLSSLGLGGHWAAGNNFERDLEASTDTQSVEEVEDCDFCHVVLPRPGRGSGPGDRWHPSPSLKAEGQQEVFGESIEVVVE